MITFHIMTEAEKETAADWKYSGEYAVYNMPCYREQKEKKTGFGNPKSINNYYAYYEDDTMIGFTNILEETGEVFLGIGISPAFCGKGYGQKVLEIAKQISAESYPGKPLYLEVRTWNKRAVACYKKAGFVIDGPVIEQKTLLAEGHFYRMICHSGVMQDRICDKEKQ